MVVSFWFVPKGVLSKKTPQYFQFSRNHELQFSFSWRAQVLWGPSRHGHHFALAVVVIKLGACRKLSCPDWTQNKLSVFWGQDKKIDQGETRSKGQMALGKCNIKGHNHKFHEGSMEVSATPRESAKASFSIGNSLRTLRRSNGFH